MLNSWKHRNNNNNMHSTIQEPIQAYIHKYKPLSINHWDISIFGGIFLVQAQFFHEYPGNYRNATRTVLEFISIVKF